ncbi:FMN-linked oxidoreductase [Paxillus ammoniavirescens]|nr:FMN-linked oxidoreductase [Paxillus ammoniavirescens]
MSNTPALFRPIKVGPVTLQHRVVLAPLTRFRAYASHVPGPQAATYYAQRGSSPGTLLITEATFISHDAGGYEHVPGIYTDAQIEGWKQVTDAVHAKGSYIFLQLWALGRTADPDVLAKQDPPSPYVSASPITLTGIEDPPRALTEPEIEEYIAAYAKAASNAVHHAGFDGVEVHSANGYLLDQFLQSVSNTRTDKWGGDEEGRTRFTREVVGAVVDAVGEERVGVRISPWSTFQDMKMPNPRPTFAYLATALRDKHPNMAYLHVTESRVAGNTDIPHTEDESNGFLREIWNSGEGGEKRIFISAGGHTRDTALSTAEELGGLVAFGRLYISNPDLPTRLQEDTPITPGDRSTYYLPGNLTPFGYSDWTFADGSTVDGKF